MTRTAQASDLNRLGIEIVKDIKLEERLRRLQVLVNELQSIGEVEGDSYEERLMSLRRRLEQINQMLHEVAIPWGRAGSEQVYAQAMRGWSGLHTMVLDAADSFLRLMRRAEEPANPSPAPRYRVEPYGADKPEQPDKSQQGGGNGERAVTVGSLLAEQIAKSLDPYKEYGGPPERQKKELYDKFRSFVVRYYVRYAQLIIQISWRGEDVAPSWSATIQQPPSYGFGGWGAMPPATGQQPSTIQSEGGFPATMPDTVKNGKRPR